MSITHITSLSQLNGILSKSNDKLSVIDFHATWCGPCHQIAPTFEALSKQYKNVNFLKCDVDAAKDVAGNYKVTAMPTFVFLRGSSKVDQVRGANRGALESTVQKHASSSGTAAFSGKGQTLGGASPPAPRGNNNGRANLWGLFGKFDPQVQVLLALISVYLVFWYFR